MNEEWRDIPTFNGVYQASNIGRIRSVDRIVNSRSGTRRVLGVVMKPTLTWNGYHRISLGSPKKQITIHRLVALTFIDNPKNEPMVNHINGLKTDNRVENLEWSSASHNMKHAYHVLGVESASKKYDDIDFITYATCLVKFTSAELLGLMNFATFRGTMTGRRISGVNLALKKHFEEFPVPRGPARNKARAALKQLSE